jgi:hypothetical protein
MFTLRNCMLMAILSVILYGCANSPATTTVIAENNSIAIMSLERGMTQPHVLKLMGYKPYKTKKIQSDGKDYIVWFYVTEGLLLGQTKYYNSNFTPLIFRNGILECWGNKYYEYLLDKGNAREKHSEKQYTDNPDDWPVDHHREVLMPSNDKPESIEEGNKGNDEDTAEAHSQKDE